MELRKLLCRLSPDIYVLSLIVTLEIFLDLVLNCSIFSDISVISEINLPDQIFSKVIKPYAMARSIPHCYNGLLELISGDDVIPKVYYKYTLSWNLSSLAPDFTDKHMIFSLINLFIFQILFSSSPGQSNAIKHIERVELEIDTNDLCVRSE